MRSPTAVVTVVAALAAATPAAAAPVAATPAAAAPVAAIRRLLDDQAAAWNRGDLDGYMAGYWRSPELTFFSGGTITRGWDATLARYRKRYQSEGHEMGLLDFSEVAIQLTGPETAVASGRWRLTLSTAKELRGLFTVLLRHRPEGWRVVHDHSSIDTP